MKDDLATQGNWSSAYGADGYSLAGSTQHLPSYASFSLTNSSEYTWVTSSTDARALSVPGGGAIAAAWFSSSSFTLNISFNDGNAHTVALYALDWDRAGRVETIQIVDPSTNDILNTQALSNFSNGDYLVWSITGQVQINVTYSAGPNGVISGIFFGNGGTSIASSPGNGSSGSNSNCPTTINAVSFIGTDTTTQGAWKGVGNFAAPPASSSLVYGKDGDILPDTESCDQACNPFPSYVSFGPQCVNSSTPGNIGSKPYSTHAYVALVQGSVMGAEPQNPSNTDFFQCNYTFSNPAAPWAPMVAWTPSVDTREISNWNTCLGITSYYLELSFGNSAHNFEVYVVDDQNGGTNLRSEELQVLDGNTNAVLYDSGSFTNFTGGVYYKWSITGHVKIKLTNTSTNGTDAVINGVFFN